MHSRWRRRGIGTRLLIVIVLVRVRILLPPILLLFHRRSRIIIILAISIIISIIMFRLLLLLLRKVRRRRGRISVMGMQSAKAQKKKAMTDPILKQIQRKSQRHGAKGRKTRRRFLSVRMLVLVTSTGHCVSSQAPCKTRHCPFGFDD